MTHPLARRRSSNLLTVTGYTAIHDADTNGNPATVPDPSWEPLDVTPGHSEDPAAHGCGTQALMDALTEFFETDEDEIPYTVTSSVTGSTHSTHRLVYTVENDALAIVACRYHYE